MPKSLWLKKYKPSVLTPPDAVALVVFKLARLLEINEMFDHVVEL